MRKKITILMCTILSIIICGALIIEEETLGYIINFSKNSSNENNDIAEGKAWSEFNLGFQELEQKLRTTLGGDIDKVGIVFYDINSKEYFAINPNKVFLGASTTKIPLAMAILDEAQKGNISLTDTVEYEAKDFYAGTGVLQDLKEIPALPVGKLIELSIIHSDNIATNMLRRVSPVSRNDYIKNITGISYDTGNNEISAAQMAIILKRLYENPDNNQYYDELIRFMKQTEFHTRLDGGLPNSIVAHKVGTLDEYVHDVGIVYTDNPYIITIYTQNIGSVYDEIGDKYIANISKIIYDYVIEGE